MWEGMEGSKDGEHHEPPTPGLSTPLGECQAGPWGWVHPTGLGWVGESSHSVRVHSPAPLPDRFSQPSHCLPTPRIIMLPP